MAVWGTYVAGRQGAQAARAWPHTAYTQEPSCRSPALISFHARPCLGALHSCLPPGRGQSAPLALPPPLQSFDYDVEMQGGKMVLTLPDSAQIVIRKDHDHSALVVRPGGCLRCGWVWNLRLKDEG